MTLSEIKQILARERVGLSKALGQNFLHDSNQIHRILAEADLQNGEKVLEIGPGLGALTHPLLARGQSVLAVEKDRRLFTLLQARFGAASSLRLVQADALRWLNETPRDWSDWKVVSNLPYSAASPLLVDLAQAAKPPERFVVTVQSEVAERLRAAPGTASYGILTLLIQAYYSPNQWFRIPPTCFYPVPDVDSACLTLRRRPAPLVAGERASVFRRIVKRGFSQRRKMMLKLLKADWPAWKLEEAFRSLGLALEVRAEAVSLEQFAALADRLAEGS